jgi:hypothetical protein
MDDLTLVGVHDDGEHLLLTGPDGRRFKLRVDDAVRAAVRRDRARLGQLQIEMNGRLRPRDIQARVRAGHTAEEIADEAHVPLAYVRRYEGPVLAEREYVAIQARTAVVRRGPGGEPTSLEMTVTERLGRRGVEPDAVGWDAWRQDDGSWVVAAEYPGEDGRGRARWVYDQGNRHVLPLDDAARLLSGDEEPRPAAPTGPRRLAPVLPSGAVMDVDAPSAWIDLPEPGAAAQADRSAVDLLDTLRERRGRRSRPMHGDEDEAAGGDPVREAIDNLLESTERAERAERGDWSGRGDRAERAERAEQAESARNHPSARGRRNPRPEGRPDVRSDGRGEGRPTPADVRPGSADGQQVLPEVGRNDERGRGGKRPVIPGRAAERSRPAPSDPADELATDQTPDVLVLPEPARPPVASRPATVTPAVEEPEPEHAAGSRKRGRASVPSWDDIVFGSRRE